MCGIFGVITNRSAQFSSADLLSAARDLMRLSESRGKEAAGLALMTTHAIRVYKQPVPGVSLFRSPACRALFDAPFSDSPATASAGLAIIGHTRLATDGGLERHENNHPVVSSGIVGIHNGIVVNVASLWKKFPQLERRLEVDTEIILALLRYFLDQGESVSTALGHTFDEIYGVANVALLIKEMGHVLLATNNGSLHIASAPDHPVVVFASEKHIIENFLKKHPRAFGGLQVTHLKPGTACAINVETIESRIIDFAGDSASTPAVGLNGFSREIVDTSEQIRAPRTTTRLVISRHHDVPRWVDDAWDRNRQAIAKLRRCRKCVMPETVPFLEFDEHGVCSGCRHYTPHIPSGPAALEEAVRPFRRTDGRPDVLVPLSGGRDSCYSLHYIKKELKMNPLAYTYDWGMVTDLARRNQSRMCAKLGVEHIWVSANIARKREYVRKNVEAWMRKPDMGIIPLFMAGDKQFFYYADKVAKQNNVDLTIYGMNRLEHTTFKSGYCNVPTGEKADLQGTAASWKMIAHYLKAFAANPRYLNTSLADTIEAFVVYYLSPVHRRYLTFETYIPWNEETIVSTLVGTYDWEISPDTPTTWRIGDGTAPFYNYIYYTVGGFTEIDAFRSNQIRLGTMDRGTALALVDRENVMRYESLQWYCDTIGIDLDRALRVINAIPKRYATDASSPIPA